MRSRSSSASRRRRRATDREAPRRAPAIRLIGNIVGAVITRLVGAVLLEQSDEWAVSRRYLAWKASPGSPILTPTGRLPWQLDRTSDRTGDRRSYTTRRATAHSMHHIPIHPAMKAGHIAGPALFFERDAVAVEQPPQGRHTDCQPGFRLGSP